MRNKALTDTKEFQALQAHHADLSKNAIKDLFQDDPARADGFSIPSLDLLFDYSKNLVNEQTIALLYDLANTCNLSEKRSALFSGSPINVTEKRAVLHPALRGSCDKDLTIENEDVSDLVAKTLEKMHACADKIRRNPLITDVVNIGIGGSDLGPRMAVQALKDYGDGANVHFVSNIDPNDLDNVLSGLTPQNTVFIIASKTFTTLETITNANSAKQWALNALGEAGIKNHFFAVTMNEEKARDFGISEDHILPLRSWIGGRYSVWSAIGLPLMVAIGFDHFRDFLKGAHEADEHFLSQDFNKNIPVIMALLGIWHRNFCNYGALAILPYAQSLALFPDYCQQLDMESNGKACDIHGQAVKHKTGPIIFGSAGTNGQHAFHQWLHQSNDIVPADFIVVAKSNNASYKQQNALVANALAQAQALMQGRDNKDEPHRSFSGNRPSSTIVLKQLTPRSLGTLMALYEHKIFVQGAIWNINSFDQWGVELGKTLASELIQHFDHNKDLAAATDASTRKLVLHLKSIK